MFCVWVEILRRCLVKILLLLKWILVGMKKMSFILKGKVRKRVILEKYKIYIFIFFLFVYEINL